MASTELLKVGSILKLKTPYCEVIFRVTQELLHDERAMTDMLKDTVHLDKASLLEKEFWFYNFDKKDMPISNTIDLVYWLDNIRPVS